MKGSDDELDIRKNLYEANKQSAEFESSTPLMAPMPSLRRSATDDTILEGGEGILDSKKKVKMTIGETQSNA